MKKIIYLAMVTLVLSGCVMATNTIVLTELTDRENAILSTTSNQSFVFDFTIDSEYKQVSLWIEKYEYGELVDEGRNMTTEVMEQGSIIFTTLQSESIENQTIFTIGVNDNEGTVSGRSSDLVSDKGSDDRFVVAGSISEEINITSEEIVLASIAYSREEGVSSFSPDFYTNVERRHRKLEEYEVTYLLVSKFSK